MKELFLVNDSFDNKVSYYHVMLLLLSLPCDMFYSHIILISLAVHTIIQFNKNSIKPFLTISNLALQSVFFLTVLSTIYTINRPQAFTEWGRQVTIFLVPLIFCFNSINLKKYRDNLLLVFSMGCTISIIYLFARAFYTIKLYDMPLSSITSAAFTNHNFSGPLFIHATFYAMQITIAIVYLVYAFIKEKPMTNRIIYLVCILILSAGIIQLSSKSVFVALLLTINIAIPWFLLNGHARLRFIAVTASLFIIVLAGIARSESFRQRYITDLQKDLSNASENEITDPRLARWKVAMQLASESPIIGHGAGSEIGLLKERFYEHKFYRSYLNGLNSHNQFISFYIKSGMIGLLVYLLTLGFGFRLAIIKKDMMLFAFMIVITAVSLSENLLDVDKGIFFYAVFFSLFIFSSENVNHGLKVKNTL